MFCMYNLYFCFYPICVLLPFSIRYDSDLFAAHLTDIIIVCLMLSLISDLYLILKIIFLTVKKFLYFVMIYKYVTYCFEILCISFVNI